MTLTFIDAGHILGSRPGRARHARTRETGRRLALLFSGDVGRGSNNLLRDPEPVRRRRLPDHGEHLRRPRARAADPSRRASWPRILNRAHREEGQDHHPRLRGRAHAAASLRPQRALRTTSRSRRSRSSSTARSRSTRPRSSASTRSASTRRSTISSSRSANPFGFENLTLIRSVEKSKELNDLGRAPRSSSRPPACARPAASCHHLKNNIETRATRSCSSATAPRTPSAGRSARGDEEVKIFGEDYKVKAKIDILDSFSGHADHWELIDYFDATGGRKRKSGLSTASGRAPRNCRRR